MNLTSPSQVRLLADELGVAPSRTLGQNFLIDKNTLDILVRESELSPSDHVLEIGPGLGVVTERLLGAVAGIVAVEKDRRLAAYLEKRWKDRQDLKVICADFLDLDSSDVAANKVVSNLPFSAASRMLVELALQDDSPEQLVVTVQQEVAERILATEGSKDYGLLTVWLGLDYTSEMIRVVKPTCFWPRPEVTSAIIRLRRRPVAALNKDLRALYHTITKQTFSQRRKQLAKVLGGNPLVEERTKDELQGLLVELGVDEKARPEALSVQAWCGLIEAIGRNGNG